MDAIEEKSETHWILAYYCFIPIEDPSAEVKIHREFLEKQDIKCRVYLSEQGINGQMSGSQESAKAYIHWMHSRQEFKNVEFKIHPYHEHVFPRLIVKYRKQLVAIDSPVDLTKRGESVSPSEWKNMLSEKKNRILLDVRNDYEWKIGHFEGAELPKCETFREFSEYADRLKKEVNPQNTPVMMYCTGGIRCELYSSILIEKGFEKVYQLDGGVIGYGLKEGNTHWLGKLFVFDDRMAIPICEEESPIIGTCHHCGKSYDSYYNCANMDCNHLFISCPDCLLKFVGCCKKECTESQNLRPFHQENAHKPFRRWYCYKNHIPEKVAQKSLKKGFLSQKQ